MTRAELLATFASVTDGDLDELLAGELQVQYATDGAGTLCRITHESDDADEFTVTDNF